MICVYAMWPMPHANDADPTNRKKNNINNSQRKLMSPISNQHERSMERFRIHWCEAVISTSLRVAYCAVVSIRFNERSLAAIYVSEAHLKSEGYSN